MSQMGRSFHIISVAYGDSSPGGGAKIRCPLRGKSREAGKGVHLPRSGYSPSNQPLATYHT